jgi:putative ABC transport system permease protein
VPFSIRPRIRRAFRLALRRRHLTEAEIDEELAYHIELRVEQLIARGLTRDQAQADARRRFGDSWTTAVRQLHDAGNLREEKLDMREQLEAVWSDVGYAVRRLARQPGFSLVVMVTFALGIGANATIFGVVDRLLLRPPPHVVSPDHVMQVGIVANSGGRERFWGRFSYPFFDLLRADTAAFTDVILSTGNATSTLNPGPTAEPIITSLVSGGFFKSLGTRPALGRLLTVDDDVESASPVAILSHAFWQRRYGGDRSIIGQTLRIGPGQFTVVGIAPPDFTGIEPKRVDAWIPVGTAGALRLIGNTWRTDWPSNWVLLYVRVRPGMGEAAVTERIKAMYTNAHEAWKSTNRITVPDEPLRIALQSILPSDQLRDNPEAKVSRLLVAVAALVLLIACANVANLLLARGAERRREIAVRLALGVSQARLVRLLVLETILLASLGGLGALLAARWGVRTLYLTLLEDFAMGDSAVDWRVIAVTVALVAFTTLVAGLVPALRASRPNVTDSLKAGGREGSASRSSGRTVLLAIQAGLSVILIVGAGLFVQSLREAATIELGYEPDRVIAVSLGVEALMGLPSLGTSKGDRRARFEHMRDRVAQVPGVAEATVASAHPLLGLRFGLGVRLRASDTLVRYGQETPSYNVITANYFTTLGIPVLDGRSITADDIAADARVVVVSQRMARRYWPNERAVGQCVFVGSDSTCTTVVGVVADAREQVSLPEPRLVIYLPATSGWEPTMNVLLVRSRGDDATGLIAPIRHAIQTSAPNLPFAEVHTLGELLAPQIRPWRVGATLFVLFGGLAVIVAAVGLYSAVSYSVAQRRHEFGVRVALGAQVMDVVGLVIGQGMRSVGLGIAAGVIVALLGGRYVADLLFQTSPKSPLVFVAVVAFMILVAFVASFVPARRASRVNPVVALRGD